MCDVHFSLAIFPDLWVQFEGSDSWQCSIFKYCKSRKFGVQENLANLALGQN